MMRYLLAEAPSYAAATKALPGKNYLWLGLLLGSLAGYIGWWWLRLGLLVVSGVTVAGQYNLFSTTRSGVHIHPSGATVIWLILIVIALLIGLRYGRLRGLQHLGSAELTSRWRTVRGVSRW
jgi:hypothetical protein